jgi:hypothetical protein
MGLFGGRRLRDPVEGTFRVTGTAVTAGEDGHRHVRLSGVLTGTGVPATGAQVSKTFLITETIPATGDELPAMIDRARPNRFTISWPARTNAATKALQDKAYAERVAAALRLGLDPSLVPAETGPPPTIRELADRAFDQRLARDLLPDGNRPVTVEEANDLYVNGLPGVATITGIDFLAVSQSAAERGRQPRERGSHGDPRRWHVLRHDGPIRFPHRGPQGTDRVRRGAGPGTHRPGRSETGLPRRTRSA